MTLPFVSNVVASSIPLNSWDDLREKLRDLSKIIVLYSRESGWQIRDLHGAIFTPQAFEAEYGYLPDNDFKWCHKHRRREKIKEWYAHRKTLAMPAVGDLKSVDCEKMGVL